MEFLAGVSVGILIGLLLGIFLPELARRSNPDRLPPREVVREEVRYLPAPQAQPEPYPYQPPVIVLAAPRPKPNGVLRVEPPPRPLLRDDW
jgi:hypothetical protein